MRKDNDHSKIAYTTGKGRLNRNFLKKKYINIAVSIKRKELYQYKSSVQRVGSGVGFTGWSSRQKLTSKASRKRSPIVLNKKNYITGGG